MNIRSGIGYDIHRLEETVGENCIRLGGVDVPCNKKVIAHSDGDILAHAVIDSLLGAAGLADIGEHFPDTDEKYRGISSIELLAETRSMLRGKGIEIINIDCIIVAQAPCLSPYKLQIRKTLADHLGIPAEDINIKAKTKEKLDAVGRGEAIECFSVAMIRFPRQDSTNERP